MASRRQDDDDPDIDINDEEWNGIEGELSTSESSEEEDDEADEHPHFVQHDPNLLQKKQEAIQHSQGALSLTKQMKQRNAEECREHGLYHRQHDQEGLLNQRYKPTVTLGKGNTKDVQNIDYSEDISLGGRRSKDGRHYSSGSSERTVSPISPTTPVLVVTGENDTDRRGRLSPRISPRGQTQRQDPWHGMRSTATSGLPSIGGHKRSDSTGLSSGGKQNNSESGRPRSPRNPRQETPDLATLSQRMQKSNLSRSSENVRQSTSPTAPLQSPRLGQSVPQPVRPRSPKVSLRMNQNGGQLYSKDELLASPNSHQRSLSAGSPRR